MKQRPFFLKPAVFAVALCFAGGLAANPSGLNVVAGQAALQSVGKTLNVRNSSGAILNWQSFSIGSGETTRFIQPSAASAVLNRVVGQDPSRILGALQSNGRVFLINPNGIMFGAGSRVDVAGLVASTLNIADRDFLAGRLNFTADDRAGKIANAGTITTPQGGRIHLVAAEVENSGVIRSPRGEIVLAAGRSVQLVDAGAPDLRVEISAPDNQAVNLGEIVAAGGRLGIYAGLIRQQGRVSADAARVDAAGRVVFKATRGVELAAGSRTSADGARGGSVGVDAGDGDALVSGSVSAGGVAGRGGEIKLLGERVALLDAATIDASGRSGGGNVRVGGDFQGRNPQLHNAAATHVAADVQIRADATGKGPGGTIVVWSDGTTRAGGELSARGGAAGGDGGLVEVSGRTHLDYGAHADIRAPQGKPGTLLLDPANLLVTDVPPDVIAGGAGFDGFGLFTGGNGPSTLTWGLIDAALSDGNVVITTSGAEAGALGDITLTAPLGAGLANLASGNDLSFLAHNDIIVDAMHLQRSAAGGIRLLAGWDGNVATPGVTGSSGSVVFNPSAVLGSGIIGSFSNIELRAAGDILKNSGQSGSIVSGGGTVQIDAKGLIGLTGTAINTTPDGFAATNGGAVTLVSGSGGITIGAVTSAGATFTGGGGNGGAVRIVSRDGAINLIGDIDSRGANGFDGSGGNGGGIEVTVGGDTLSPAVRTTSAAWAISSNGALNSSGGTGSNGSFISPIGNGGSGGNIVVATDLATAGGSITLPNAVTADGINGGDDSVQAFAGANGGSAGDITVRAGAGSDLTFSRFFARGGGGGDGTSAGLARPGGTITLTAGRDIINDGAHFAAGLVAAGGGGGSITIGGGTAGSGGNGGVIDVFAGRDLKLITGNDGGAIAASGGGGGAGIIGAGGLGGAGGSGGGVSLNAGRELALDASIFATGAGNGSGVAVGGGGAGGTVSLAVHPSGGSGTIVATTGGTSGGIRIDTSNGGGVIGGGSVALLGIGGDLVVDSKRAPAQLAIGTDSPADFAIRAGRDITLKAPIANATAVLISARDAAAAPTGSGGSVVFDRFAAGGKHLLPLIASDSVITVKAPSGRISSRTTFADAVADLRTPGSSIVLDARDGIGGQPTIAAAFNNPLFVDDWFDFGQVASLHFRNTGAGDVWIASNRPLDVDEGRAANGNIRLESAANPGVTGVSSPSPSLIGLARAGGNLLGLGGDVVAPNGSVTYVADQFRLTGAGAFGKTSAGVAIEVQPFSATASVSVDSSLSGESSGLLTAAEIAAMAAPQLVVGDFSRSGSLTLLDSLALTSPPQALQRPAALGGIELRAAGNVVFNAPLLFAGGDVGGSSAGGNVTVNAVAPISASNIKLDAGTSGSVNLNGALAASASITLAGATINGASGLSTPGALNVITSGGITLNAAVGSFSAINGGGGLVSFTDADGFNVDALDNPGGTIALDAGSGPLTQTGIIVGDALGASAGSIDLGLGNQLAAFSGNATTIVTFANAGDVTIGSVVAPRVVLDAGSGALTLSGPITAPLELTLAGRSVVGANGLATASLRVDTVDGFSGSGSVDRLVASNTGSGALAFSNDQGLVLGGIGNAGGSITLATTAGDLINDGGITSGGGTIALSAAGGITNKAPGINSGGGDVALLAAGDIATMLIDAGAGTVRLSSTGGAIVDNDGAATSVFGSSLDLAAATGIGTPLLALDTQTATLTARTGSGGIHIHNILPAAAASFQLAGATAAAGDISIDNVGAMVTSALIQVQSGDLGLLAQSPLTIGAPIFASGNIVLTAGGRTAPNDLLAINANVTSTAGDISLDAADAITQNGLIATGGGSVGVRSGGPFAMSPTSTIRSGNGPVAIDAAGDIVLGLVDGGIGSVRIESLNGSIGSADPALTNNVRAGALRLNANTGIKVTYSAKSLQVSNNNGFVTVRNADTGAVISDDPALIPPPADAATGDEAGGEPPPDAVSEAVNSSNASIDNATDNVLPDEQQDDSTGDRSDDKKKKQKSAETTDDKSDEQKKGVGVCNA